MKKQQKYKDTRVTAPLISWKVFITVFGIIYFLIVGQAFILSAYLDRIPTLIGVLAYYLICTCILITVLFGLFWRCVIGKPLRKIAEAARRVTGGDFSVQIESSRKDDRKNEVDVLIDDFNRMTRELAGNEMFKSDFISNVSHEIKTPLSIIQSYTKALKDGYAAPEQREQYMDTILTASENLNAMITNILKLNKLENQQIFSAPETYQLGEQLRRCALSYMEQWQEKEIEFEMDAEDVAVCYDASLLELVWNNLLSNAVKFTEKGGRISLTSRTEDNAVFVTIKDTGCGIDRETQKRIFEKFYQGDTSHASEGNGLGLALVKKVIEIIGGEITVESTPGKGTAFTVKIIL